MFCKICGNELHEKAIVCPKCGCAISEDKCNKKNINGLNEPNEDIITKLFNAFRYISVGLICISLALLIMTIFGDWIIVIPLLILGILGFLSSTALFIIGFMNKDKEKAFANYVVFMISVALLAVSILFMCYL